MKFLKYRFGFLPNYGFLMFLFKYEAQNFPYFQQVPDEISVSGTFRSIMTLSLDVVWLDLISTVNSRWRVRPIVNNKKINRHKFKGYIFRKILQNNINTWYIFLALFKGKSILFSR